MIEIYGIVSTQIFLLLLVFVGIITVKAGIVDERGRSSMTDLLLNVFLPCNILSGFFSTDSSRLSSFGIMLGISVGILALFYFLSRFVLYRRATAEQRKILIYGSIINAANFLGIPIVQNIFGIEALPLVAAYLMPGRVALWTVGLAIFSGGKGSIKQIVLHPCMIATYIGIIITVSGFVPPRLFSRLVISLGNCTTPVSMIVVGSILAMVDPRTVITKLTLYYTFVRLLLLPLLVMGILLIFRPDPLICGVSVIVSGMPAGVTTSILAEKYGADKELASKIVFLSTLLSMVSAPVLAWILHAVL